MNLKKFKKGFSLVEMLVVVAIIGVLSTVLYTSYTKYVTESKKAVAKAEALEIVEVYQTAMVNHYGKERDEEITVENYITFNELASLDLKEAYTEATGNTLPATTLLSYDSSSKSIIYTANGIKVTYNTTSNSVTSVDEV